MARTLSTDAPAPLMVTSESMATTAFADPSMRAVPSTTKTASVCSPAASDTSFWMPTMTLPSVAVGSTCSSVWATAGRTVSMSATHASSSARKSDRGMWVLLVRRSSAVRQSLA